jgi:hypothetical protein
MGKKAMKFIHGARFNTKTADATRCEDQQGKRGHEMHRAIQQQNSPMLRGARTTRRTMKFIHCAIQQNGVDRGGKDGEIQQNDATSCESNQAMHHTNPTSTEETQDRKDEESQFSLFAW